MNEKMLAVLHGFRMDGEPVSCEPYGSGHINATYLVVTQSGRRYILQMINRHTFRDVAGLMENISSVTEHLRRKSDDKRRLLPLRTGGILAHVQFCGGHDLPPASRNG